MPVWYMLRVLLGILISLIWHQSQAGPADVNIEEPKPDLTVGLTPKCQERLCWYIDETGDFKIPRIYKMAMPFHEKLASVYKEGEEWGVIDPHGNYVVKPSFAWIGPFSEGLAAAQVSQKNLYHWAYIDRDGRIAIDFKFNVARAFPFHEGKAWLSCPYLFAEQKKQIDRTGKVLQTILPP